LNLFLEFIGGDYPILAPKLNSDLPYPLKDKNDGKATMRRPTMGKFLIPWWGFAVAAIFLLPI
jgi:hypothetical protein